MPPVLQDSSTIEGIAPYKPEFFRILRISKDAGEFCLADSISIFHYGVLLILLNYIEVDPKTSEASDSTLANNLTLCVFFNMVLYMTLSTLCIGFPKTPDLKEEYDRIERERGTIPALLTDERDSAKALDNIAILYRNLLIMSAILSIPGAACLYYSASIMSQFGVPKETADSVGGRLAPYALLIPIRSLGLSAETYITGYNVKLALRLQMLNVLTCITLAFLVGKIRPMRELSVLVFYTVEATIVLFLYNYFLLFGKDLQKYELLKRLIASFGITTLPPTTPLQTLSVRPEDLSMVSAEDSSSTSPQSRFCESFLLLFFQGLSFVTVNLGKHGYNLGMEWDTRRFLSEKERVVYSLLTPPAMLVSFVAINIGFASRLLMTKREVYRGAAYDGLLVSGITLPLIPLMIFLFSGQYLMLFNQNDSEVRQLLSTASLLLSVVALTEVIRTVMIVHMRKGGNNLWHAALSALIGSACGLTVSAIIQNFYGMYISMLASNITTIALIYRPWRNTVDDKPQAQRNGFFNQAQGLSKRIYNCCLGARPEQETPSFA